MSRHNYDVQTIFRILIHCHDNFLSWHSLLDIRYKKKQVEHLSFLLWQDIYKIYIKHTFIVGQYNVTHQNNSYFSGVSKLNSIKATKDFFVLHKMVSHACTMNHSRQSFVTMATRENNGPWETNNKSGATWKIWEPISPRNCPSNLRLNSKSILL